MDIAEFYFKVLSSVAGAIYVYHKFITSQLEKKVDKDDCNMMYKHMQELREENMKTLFKTISKIEERLARIEGYFMKKPINHE